MQKEMDIRTWISGLIDDVIVEECKKVGASDEYIQEALNHWETDSVTLEEMIEQAIKCYVKDWCDWKKDYEAWDEIRSTGY